MPTEAEILSGLEKSVARSPDIYHHISHRLEEDISFRIRSLLISRNRCYPPRTPYPSDESSPKILNPYNSDLLGIGVSKPESFGSAPRSTRKDCINQGNSGPVKIFARKPQSHLKDDHLIRPKKTSVRGITLTRQKPATVYLSKKFDKEASESLSLGKTVSLKQNKSNRIDINSPVGVGLCTTVSPLAENISQESEHQSWDFQGPRLLKSILDPPKSTSPTLLITSGDLSCFVGGCYPGNFNCKTHNTNSTWSAVLEGTKNRVLECQNKIASEEKSDIFSEDQKVNNPPKATDLRFSKKCCGLDIWDKSSKGKNLESTNNTMNSSMASGSIDALPHNVWSLKLAMEEYQEPPYSTTIKTNFSLPGVKAKVGDIKLRDDLESSIRGDHPRKESIRGEKSEISSKSRPKSPSLLSAASRKSARHSLLKPSFTDNRSLELGLATPPVLYTMPSCLDEKKLATSIDHVKKDLEVIQPESNEKLLPASPSTNFKESKFVDHATMTRSFSEQSCKVIVPPETVKVKIPQSSDNICYSGYGFNQPTNELSPQDIAPAKIVPVENVNLFPEREDDGNSHGFLKNDIGFHDEATAISDTPLNATSLNEHPQSLETELKILGPVDPLKSEIAWWRDDSSQQKLLENHVLSSLQPNVSAFKDQENQPQRNANFGKLSTKIKPSERFDTLKISINTETGATHPKLEKTDHKKIRNKTDVISYTAIPSQDSTKTHVLSPILASPDSTGNNDPIYEFSQGNLGTGKNTGPHSISSAESFVSSKSEIKVQDSTDLIHPNPLEIHHIGNSYKNTVHWLKNLLPGTSPSENLLTALPSRTIQEQDLSNCVQKDIEDDHEISESPLNTDSEQSKQELDMIKTFVNSINDLETLMSEALSIARQAADSRDPTKEFSVLENATKVLKSDHVSHSATRNENSHLYSDENQTYHSDETQVLRPEKKKKAVNDTTTESTDRTRGDFNHTSKIKNPYSKDSEASGSNSPRYRPPKSSDRSVDQRIDGLNWSDANMSQDEKFFKRANLRSLSLQMLVPNETIETQKSPESLQQHSIPSSKILSANEKLSAIGQRNLQQNFSKQNVRSKRLKKPCSSRSFLNDQLNKDFKKEDSEAMDLKKHRTIFMSNPNDLGLARNDAVDFSAYPSLKHLSVSETGLGLLTREIELQDYRDRNSPQPSVSNHAKQFSLSGKTHVSLKENNLKGFSPAKTHKSHPIARDWSPGRKRLVATAACFSTALIGILVGIYAGETPAIQYYIVDFHHYTVLGNVFFFFGLAVPTFFAWPLPLLHGRKPYILVALSLAMPLLFPQALAVGDFRSPYIPSWRVGLLVSRTVMGFCLGFANINFKCMLTDLFGASLQSTNPHQEHVDDFDVRRHGGGMGVWLGLWTWSALGSIGLGFLIGACIIETLPPSWGFYISIIIIAFVMLLNIVCPEVRRSAYRRSIAKVVTKDTVSHRLARGEVKMHMVKVGPKWWGEELQYGIKLSQRMIRQPGFLIMSLYVAWIYGQQVLIILLLGALISRDYHLRSPLVGLCVMAIPFGALIAIPFQKASLFSRSRRNPPLDNDGTLSKKKIYWSSHMLRRAIFVLFLPIFGLLVTLTTSGPPVPLVLPVLGSGIIGFLSNLAIAECHGIIMETFDTSDLEPCISDHPRDFSDSRNPAKITNYSSFPRVSSAFAITESFGYIIAAGASGVGGVLTRKLGRQAAIGLMASVLLVLSLLLLGVLVRFTEVQIIPDSRMDDMNRYQARRASQTQHGAVTANDEETWRPIIIGNPHQSTRRMCILELGSLSRFSEIRMRNRLIDDMSLEARHPNRNAMNSLERRIKEKEAEIVNNFRRSISRSSRGSRRIENPETSANGGRREFLSAEVESNRRQKNSSYNRERKISE